LAALNSAMRLDNSTVSRSESFSVLDGGGESLGLS
jgi:hypothetical protein